MDINELDLNHPYVIDNGSGMIKAGFAADEAPKLTFPTQVGRAKHQKVMMSGARAGELFVGSKAEELRGLLRLSNPITRGVVQDWKDMEAVWDYTYRELKIVRDLHPVLITEPPLNPRSNRENMAEVFFERFNVPAMYVQMSPILSLYASGRTTGVVLDSGDTVTSAVPVVEGFAIKHAIQRIDVGGRDVTEHMALLLRKAGYPFHTSAEMRIVNTIKEKQAEVAYSTEQTEKEADVTDISEEYKLPDGSEIKLGAEKFRAPEVLFNPALIGLEYPGLQRVIINSISRCDLDLRRQLFHYILLAGGSTMFDGFGDRLVSELRQLSPRNTKIKIYAPPRRNYSAWTGGSILASLASFQRMWVTRSDFQEEGRSILYRKMF